MRTHSARTNDTLRYMRIAQGLFNSILPVYCNLGFWQKGIVSFQLNLKRNTGHDNKGWGSKNISRENFVDPATGELDIGSWYVTHLPTPPPRNLCVVVVQAGSLKKFLLCLLLSVLWGVRCLIWYQAWYWATWIIYELLFGHVNDILRTLEDLRMTYWACDWNN